MRKTLLYLLLSIMALTGTARDMDDDRQPLPPHLTLDHQQIAAGQPTTLTLNISTAQRGFMQHIGIVIPKGIRVSDATATVNVIGRGAVPLNRLHSQYMGRYGNAYSLNKVGEATVLPRKDGSTLIALSNIDLRVDNGIDLQLVIPDVILPKKGTYVFTADYRPFLLPADRQLPESLRGPSFRTTHLVTSAKGSVSLSVGKAPVATPVADYSVRRDAYQEFGIIADGMTDQSDKINSAIRQLAAEGGGTLFFPAGRKAVLTGTVTLESNVWIEIGQDAELAMAPGTYPVEPTWWIDDDTNAGNRCYNQPDNYLTKQDVGHSFFHNCMFFGQRVSNVRIFGNGRINGNGNLKHDNNRELTAADKMFVFKLCNDIEVGGISKGKDLWYDDSADDINALPFYLNDDLTRDDDIGNVLQIDRGGHFVILATGTDNLRVHDICYGLHTDYPRQNGDTRDIFDFMECCDVDVRNIYAKYCGDDVVKFGSECSLGFTRKGNNFRIRNIIGNTNCNVFQIGSETADDLRHFYIDNLYVLGANKAGFSISTNDGANVAHIYLNHGLTGRVHSRSQFRRTRSPFFFSISNRGRVLGCQAEEFEFTEKQMEGTHTRRELLCTNIPIGSVDSIFLKGVDAKEIFAGARSDKFPAYERQDWQPVIIAGYKYPDADHIIRGNYTHLPEVKTGRITNVTFDDLCLSVKGGRPASDSLQICPELGIGMFNMRNFNIQPSHGFWGRHTQDITFKRCIITCEEPDGRPAIRMENQ